MSKNELKIQVLNLQTVFWKPVVWNIRMKIFRNLYVDQYDPHSGDIGDEGEGYQRSREPRVHLCQNLVTNQTD